MKNLFNFNAMSNSVKIAFLSVVSAFFLVSFSNNEKITICHIPPGNVYNCQQITISIYALQAHLDHGDKLFCYEQIEYESYLELVDNNQEKIIKMYQPH